MERLQILLHGLVLSSLAGSIVLRQPDQFAAFACQCTLSSLLALHFLLKSSKSHSGVKILHFHLCPLSSKLLHNPLYNQASQHFPINHSLAHKPKLRPADLAGCHTNNMHLIVHLHTYVYCLAAMPLHKEASSSHTHSPSTSRPSTEVAL